jgi:DNA-binding transcriptional regulator YbjK
MPRQPRGEERRSQILRATLAVIGRSGIPAVTHRSVAEEAGVPLGSLTYYFESKDELLRDALLLFVSEEAERLRVLGESIAEQELAPEQIADGFSALLETEKGPEQIAQFELYLEAARNPALREPAERCFRAYEEIAAAALRAAGVPDPDRAAALFVAMADGLGLRRVAAPGTGAELRAALLDLFHGVQHGAVRA